MTPETASINPLAEANKADVGDKDVVETKASTLTYESACQWLEECAIYFERKACGTKEDSEFWANTKNSENARQIAKFIRGLPYG